MAVVQNVTIHDLVQALVDTIDQEPDPAIRLRHYSYLSGEWQRLVLKHRDAATYAARWRHSVNALSRITGIDPQTIIRWYRRHREATGAAPVPSHRYDPIEGAVDLTQITGR